MLYKRVLQKKMISSSDTYNPTVEVVIWHRQSSSEAIIPTLLVDDIYSNCDSDTFEWELSGFYIISSCT